MIGSPPRFAGGGGMKPLSEVSLGNRIAITVAIVVAIVLLLALFGYLGGRWEAEAAPRGYQVASAEAEPCMSVETREKIRVIVNEGIDQALRDHIHRMFDVWMKDETKQPERARHGARQGIRAYIGTRKVAADWNPAIC
jgi:hypothetical protein